MKPLEPVLTLHLFPEEREALLRLLASFSAPKWDLLTVCPGWSVKDIAAHLLADDLGRLARGRDAYAPAAFIPSGPENVEGQLLEFINRQNESWVAGARRLSPRVLIDLLRWSGDETQKYFESLDMFAIGEPVSWAGPEPAPVWLDIAREYTERWLHQAQIRDAVSAPPLTQPRLFLPVLDTFVRALPHTFRSTERSLGTHVLLLITRIGETSSPAMVAGARGDALVAVRFRHIRAVHHREDGRGHGLAPLYQGPDQARGAGADDDYGRSRVRRNAPRHRLDHRLMPDYARIYARQEYLTPGAAETVEIIADTVQPSEGSVLLDVACGKGEAAATLAGRFACRIAAVELYDPFIHHTAAKAWFFNLRDLITVLRADGRRLPARDGAFDAAYCIGAPSIVGLSDCLREMARVTKPGGYVVVSDIVWRSKPESLGQEWKWLARTPPISREDYSGAIETAGLLVEREHPHGRGVWDEYWRPMLDVAHEAKTSQPADIGLADDIESAVALERRAVDQHIDYATFVAKKA
jgi:uncharacterized protein (TIGR03083 family)